MSNIYQHPTADYVAHEQALHQDWQKQADEDERKEIQASLKRNTSPEKKVQQLWYTHKIATLSQQDLAELLEQLSRFDPKVCFRDGCLMGTTWSKRIPKLIARKVQQPTAIQLCRMNRHGKVTSAFAYFYNELGKQQQELNLYCLI